jgi:hypothetical protein
MVCSEKEKKIAYPDENIVIFDLQTTVEFRHKHRYSISRPKELLNYIARNELTTSLNGFNYSKRSTSATIV